MKKICAWCNKPMGSTQSGADTTALVTHSICRECTDNLDFQLGVTLARHIESLKVPIIAHDQDGTVLACNSLAEAIAGRLPATAPAWDGSIHECAHARLPEGCRNAVHCSGCAIRFITNDVYDSGVSQQGILAHFNHCTSDLNEKADLLLSAEKIGNIVHLNIIRL